MSDDGKTVVLVADDEPTMRALVTSHLRSKGYKVLEAADGDEAWELAHEHLPHLVVLDVMMPGMSGWEVCRKIREAVSLAHTGVIMLTGIGEHLNEMTSPLYGADAYVDKPFEFHKLDEKIRETLDRRRSAAQARGEPRASGGADDFAGDVRAVKSSEIREAAKAKKATRKRSAPNPAGEPVTPEKAPAPRATAKKPAAKKPAAKKPAAKKPAAKKPAAKKAPARMSAKQVGKKAPAKKTAKKAAKKTPAKKAAKKAPAKQVAKKAPARKTAKKAARKTPAKKTAKKRRAKKA